MERAGEVTGSCDIEEGQAHGQEFVLLAARQGTAGQLDPFGDLAWAGDSAAGGFDGAGPQSGDVVAHRQVTALVYTVTDLEIEVSRACHTIAEPLGNVGGVALKHPFWRVPCATRRAGVEVGIAEAAAGRAVQVQVAGDRGEEAFLPEQVADVGVSVDGAEAIVVGGSDEGRPPGPRLRGRRQLSGQCGYGCTVEGVDRVQLGDAGGAVQGGDVGLEGQRAAQGVFAGAVPTTRTLPGSA